MNFFEIVEKGFYWIGQNGLLNSDAEKQCQINAAIDERTFVTTSDAVISFIRLYGTAKVIGAEEFDTAVEGITRKLAAYMKMGTGSQHSFGFGFLVDPDAADQLAGELLKPLASTCMRLGMKSDALIRDMMGVLKGSTQEEINVMVVMTHPEGLTSDERKLMTAWRLRQSKHFAAHGSVDDEQAQTPEYHGPLLMPRHRGLVDTLVRDLAKDNIGIIADVMSAKEVSRMHRRFLDRDPLPADDWCAAMVGDPMVQKAATRPRDASHMFPMRYGRQLLTSSVRERFYDVEAAKYGNWLYGSVILEQAPSSEEPPTFEELVDQLGRRIPWSANFEILPNGLEFNKAEQMLSGFMGAFGDHNRNIKQAFELLKTFKAGGHYVCALRATFMTWARTPDELTTRLSYLKLAVQGWGSAVCTNETGAPGLAYMSGAPGFTKRALSPYLAGPLRTILHMMPFSRPASLWKHGGLILRTKGGRPYPIQLGSTLQTYWGMLIFAPPGSGKSFLLNCINRGNVIAPGMQELPYMTLIESGLSGTGVANFMKDNLPDHLARQILTIRMRNSVEYAVNPFDTYVGCEMPTESQMDFQLAMLGTLCMNLGNEADNFLSQVIREAYRMLASDSPKARRFQRSYDQRVSDALDDIGFVEVPQVTTMWDVVKALFEAGRVHEAWLANRYAVPTLQTLIEASNSPTIRDQYGNAPAATGENIIPVFHRLIMAAQSNFEVISTYTRYDVGDARIVVFDMEEITRAASSDGGKQRAAVMCLFARQLGAGQYFTHWDELRSVVPETYRSYHQKRAAKMREGLKFIEYDELHNFRGIKAAMNLLAKDAREGRKYKVVAILSSQYVEDFPRELINAANSYLILGKGSDTSARQIQDTFGLTPSESYEIDQYLNGPDEVLGAPLFALFKTGRGRISQLLYNSAGPLELWAYTSSGDDADVRKLMADRIGYGRALSYLSARFPRNGMFREYLDSLRLRMGHRRGDSDQDQRFIEQVAEALSREALEPARLEAA